MTRAIKEQLLLNSFLPRRTILAGGTWLTESPAASDLMPARQMYLWTSSGCRRNQGWAAATIHEEEASLTSFTSASPFAPFFKEDQRQCPERLGWSHLPAQREENCCQNACQLLLSSVCHFTHPFWRWLKGPILGERFFLKEWSGIGPGCPGQWGSPHPWSGSKTVWMWHLGTQFSRHG